jgi:peptide/nickel transport system substrate-binding protein
MKLGGLVSDDMNGTIARPSRRAVLRSAALAAGGLAAAALIGCGGGDDEEVPSSGTPTGSGTAQASSDPRYPADPKLPYPFNFPEPDKQAKAGGTLHVAATWDVSTMDPTKSAAGGTIVVPNLVYNRLLGIKGGPNANPFKIETQPELARSWEFSPDGLTATFRVQGGVKWQNVAPLNGRPFVADDVVFALKRYSTEGVHQSYYVNVESIEAPDAATVRIKLKKPTPEFEVPLGSRYQTIFPRELVDSGEIDKKAVGTGAMIMTEALAAQRVAFTKNPDYWRAKVLLDGAEFRITPDPAARLAAFRSGQLEYAYALATSKREVDEITKGMPNLQINIPAVVSNGTPFSLNVSNPKFQDVRVRRALSLALDKKAINNLLYDGIGEEQIHVLPWTYVFDTKPADLGQWARFDLAESKKQLQAAGITDFSFNYIYYAYTTASERLSEIIVDQMRTAGITMKGGKVDYTEFNSQWIGAKLPEATTTGYGAIGFDANTFFYNQMHSKSPGNRWQLKDPQIDTWAEQQSTELDPAKRREIHRKIWDYDLDQMYRPPLPFGYTFEIMQPWLRGIRFGGIFSSNSSYYDWGAQIEGAWLDK